MTYKFTLVHADMSAVKEGKAAPPGQDIATMLVAAGLFHDVVMCRLEIRSKSAKVKVGPIYIADPYARIVVNEIEMEVTVIEST